MISELKTRIETDRFDACVAFYEQRLGLQVRERWDSDGDRGVIFSASAGTAGNALELAEGSSSRRPTGLSLQFRVDDLTPWATRLEDLGGRGPIARPWGARYLYLEDPAGVQVILYDMLASP